MITPLNTLYAQYKGNQILIKSKRNRNLNTGSKNYILAYSTSCGKGRNDGK
jgi:hypothetical protein